MKKLIYCALALAAGLFASSCQQENLEPVAQGNTVTYTVELPGIATKAEADRWIGDGNNVNQLIYEVWRTEGQNDNVLDIKENKTYLLFRKEAAVLNGKASFTVDLVNNQNYTILFWAQVKNTGHYNTYNLQTTNLRNIEMISNTDAFDESRAAFFGVDYITKDEVRRARQTVTLHRPFGQINLGTVVKTEAELGYELSVVNTAVTVSGVATAFNVATGAAVNDNQVVAFSSVEPAKYAETYPESTKLAVNSTEYQWISMNYIFVPQGDKSTVEVSYDINTNHGLVENTISNVPVKVNYKTNIVGNLLTSGTEYEVILDNTWSGADENVNVWDGTTVSMPDYNDQTETYTITNGAELAWLAAAANGTLPEETRASQGPQDFAGKTFVLANDIYLGNHDWTPISMSSKLGAGETFRGTFDGNGKTISGLNVNQSEVAGLFGYVYAATIKNVTVEGASINSNHFAGGIVAWVNNSTGNIQVPFVLENCHVKNSTIVSTPELVNGEWDNGDKVGGLVGHAYFGGTSNDKFYAPNQGAKISGCSVDNTTIKAYRDFAGLVGYASYVAIENSTTTNVTLEQDLTHDYKAPNTPTTFGLTIGRNEGGNTIDGNEYSTDGYTIDAEGNYLLYDASALKWLASEVNKYSNYERPFEGVTLKLMNDIDLGGMEWTPIGDYRFSANRFCGTFDGQNHTISNFKITKKTDKDDSNKSSYGFFGNLEGTVKNLTIADATVNSYAYTGALVGRLNNGLIENCHVVNSTVSNTYWQGGILVGQVNAEGEEVNAIVRNCSVESSSMTSKSAIGAISGPVTATKGGNITFESCEVLDCEIIQEGSFGGSYDNYFGTMFGYLEADATSRIDVNNCTAINTTVKGDSDAMFSGDNDGNVYFNGGVPVATSEDLAAAIKKGGNYILVADVAMTEATYQNVDFTLDGNGHTIRQVDGSTNTYALFDSVTGKLTLKNVKFAGIKGGAVLRTIGAEATIENVTIEGAETTQQQGLLRLIGKSTIKNCTFKNNTCSMVITLNYDGANNDPQVVENCVFEGNTCNGTAALYYVKGESATINGNKFIGNTVNCNSNGATIYMGFTENNIVTNNLFQNNTVNEASESSRVAGGIFFGYETVFTGNAFVGNKVTGKNAKGNDVCVSTHYTSIDLSGNYWNGRAPIEDVNYFVQHKSDERVVTINNFLKENPFNN